MGDKATQPFADNWSYIKTELNWLDRLLLLAVGRQRRESKELDKLGRNPRDKVTRHWWRGIVSFDTPPAYDDGRPATVASEETVPGQQSNPATSPPASHQQLLEARVRASQDQGIVLGLPILRDRLNLTPFEKNVILLGLAPEVNRRYGRLYAYLQENEAVVLPQLDLALKLLCRNDQDWQACRMRLVNESPLLRSGLISLEATGDQPLLNHAIKLSEPLVNFLLANPLESHHVEQLLALAESTSPTVSGLLTGPGRSLPALPPRSLRSAVAAVLPAGVAPAVSWDTVLLPPQLLQELKVLAYRLSLAAQVVPEAPAIAPITLNPPGTLAALIGPAGSGKTLAAEAIATAAQTWLTVVDLALYSLSEIPALLQDLLSRSPTVLLFKTSQRLFHPDVDPAVWSAFCQQRRQSPSLTLLSLETIAKLPQRSQQHCDRLLTFPTPDADTRQLLWQRAFPKTVKCDRRIPWAKLAQDRSLTGGQIQAIAQDAIVYMLAAGQKSVTYPLIRKAIEQRFPPER